MPSRLLAISSSEFCNTSADIAFPSQWHASLFCLPQLLPFPSHCCGEQPLKRYSPTGDEDKMKHVCCIVYLVRCSVQFMSQACNCSCRAFYEHQHKLSLNNHISRSTANMWLVNNVRLLLLGTSGVTSFSREGKPEWLRLVGVPGVLC